MFTDTRSIMSSSFNIGDNVYYSLLKNIVNLNLKPGEPLNVKNISEQLNVSRTPVRDALIKLGKEGLVDVFPQKGTSVSQIDIRRVREELFLRQSLEVSAVTAFIQKHTPHHIDILTNYVHLQKECLAAQNFPAFLGYDDDFHHVFFDAIDKNMCWDTIQSLSGHYRRVRLMSTWDQQISSNIIEQHQRMIDNIVVGNVPIVQQLFLEHLSKIITEIEELSCKYPDYFKEHREDNFLLKDFLRR